MAIGNAFFMLTAGVVVLLFGSTIGDPTTGGVLMIIGAALVMGGGVWGGLSLRTMMKKDKEEGSPVFSRLSMISLGVSIATVGGMALMFGNANLSPSLSLIGGAIAFAGAGLAVASFIFMAREGAEKFSRSPGEEGVPIGPGMVKDFIFDPHYGEELAKSLKEKGLTSRPLSKDDPEAIQGHGEIVGDPVNARVKVEGRNFDLIEVWRTPGAGPGDWFRYFLVYIVKVRGTENAKDCSADLSWKSAGGELANLFWNGGELASRLNKDEGVGMMLIDLGLPNVHIGRPWLAGNYVVKSNVTLGYVGIQLLPRDGDLSAEGMYLRPEISGDRGFPSLLQLKVADRIAEHVRRQLEGGPL